MLGFALSKLCFDGPEDELTLTKHTQPAILTTSIAVFRVLCEPRPRVRRRRRALARRVDARWSPPARSRCATPCGSTHLRGTYMQEAVPVGEGAMAALMGLDLAATRGSVRAGVAARRAGRAGEPQRRRPDRDLRPHGGDRSRDPRGQGRGRQARDEARGERTLPLLADEAGRRALAAALAGVAIDDAARAGGRERDRGADAGSGADQGAARRSRSPRRCAGRSRSRRSRSSA